MNNPPDNPHSPPPHSNHDQTKISHSRLSSFSGSITKIFHGKKSRRTNVNMVVADACSDPESHFTAEPLHPPFSEAPSQPHTQLTESCAVPAGPPPQLPAINATAATSNDDSTGDAPAEEGFQPPNIPQVREQNIVRHWNHNRRAVSNAPSSIQGLSIPNDTNTAHQLWVDINGFLRAGPSQTEMSHSTVTLLVSHISFAPSCDHSEGAPDDVSGPPEAVHDTQPNRRRRSPRDIHELQDGSHDPSPQGSATPARPVTHENDAHRFLSPTNTSIGSQSSVPIHQPPPQGQNGPRADDQAVVHNPGHAHVAPVANTAGLSQPAWISQDYAEPPGLVSQRQQDMVTVNHQSTTRIIGTTSAAAQEPAPTQGSNPHPPPDPTGGNVLHNGSSSHHLIMRDQNNALSANDQLHEPPPVVGGPPTSSVITQWPPVSHTLVSHPPQATVRTNYLPFTRPDDWEITWKQYPKLTPKCPVTVAQCLYILHECPYLESLECTLVSGGLPQYADHRLRVQSLLSLRINTSAPPSSLFNHLLLPSLQSLHVQWNAPGHVPTQRELGIRSMMASSPQQSCELQELLLIGLYPPEDELLDCLSLASNTLQRLVIRTDPDLHLSDGMMISRRLLQQLTLLSVHQLCPGLRYIELCPIHAMDRDYLTAMQDSRGDELQKIRFLLASG
ncbi:hypothetical protein Hypma_010706 [Hypsizygus marmoreus]|uniref:Uncharacterized protein n=1 Tax=Hypsizygus marmoreus TaxID=39966 RepID=A0A369JTZ8_HYPMA|nr:hypothetical protein Hypma_010706 [Hypsizygus marmoreus]